MKVVSSPNGAGQESFFVNSVERDPHHFTGGFDQHSQVLAMSDVQQ
jgi:hypothetical protein